MKLPAVSYQLSAFAESSLLKAERFLFDL